MDSVVITNITFADINYAGLETMLSVSNCTSVLLDTLIVSNTVVSAENSFMFTNISTMQINNFTVSHFSSLVSDTASPIVFMDCGQILVEDFFIREIQISRALVTMQNNVAITFKNATFLQKLGPNLYSGSTIIQQVFYIYQLTTLTITEVNLDLSFWTQQFLNLSQTQTVTISKIKLLLDQMIPNVLPVFDFSDISVKVAISNLYGMRI